MQLTTEDWISWAAYYAVKSGPPSFISKSHMLPLFTESANSPITMLQCMKTIKCDTVYLNPGQAPVMVADQPLYTLAKLLQWKYPDTTIAEDWSCLEPCTLKRCCGQSRVTGWSAVGGPQL